MVKSKTKKKKKGIFPWLHQLRIVRGLIKKRRKENDVIK